MLFRSRSCGIFSRAYEVSSVMLLLRLVEIDYAVVVESEGLKTVAEAMRAHNLLEGIEGKTELIQYYLECSCIYICDMRP